MIDEPKPTPQTVRDAAVVAFAAGVVVGMVAGAVITVLVSALA